ncbi:hypothetical protein LTS15_001688 [Exophiala xenobiotica]|nr:hypothetical protein LTS15_001688 [Exophiala xenobiotica]
MAVLANLEVTISSQGNTLQEYDVDPGEVSDILSDSSSQPAATIVKYIEAIPGAEFQINSKITKRQAFGMADYLIFNTYVDGQHILSPVIKWKNLDGRGCYAYTEAGVVSREEGAVWRKNPFRWRELLTSEQVSQARPVKSTRVRKGECIDSGPLAEFVFLYRSKHALQILDVLPQTPPPPPLEAKATEALTLEEARTLPDRQKAELEAARLAIERLEAQKPKLEENVGVLWPSVAPTVALPNGDHEEDAKVNSIVKREAPDQSDVNESLRSTEPPKKRIKHEPEVIYLSY